MPILGGVIEEYVECQSCRKRFSLTVLRARIHESAEEVINGLKIKLTDGMPIEEAESRLAEAGMTIGTIKQYVSIAAGIGRRRCPECNLTYRKYVMNCRKCSHSLPQAECFGVPL